MINLDLLFEAGSKAGLTDMEVYEDKIVLKPIKK